MLEDKRKNPRLDFVIVVFHDGKRRRTKDISLNGTFIKKEQWDKDVELAPIGSEIDFSFEFPHRSRYIDVKGVVVHHGKNDDGMGIWFKKIEERNKEFIKRFILDYL